jgi:alpha-tubulin suppressor-like RCC1 family protein
MILQPAEAFVPGHPHDQGQGPGKRRGKGKGKGRWEGRDDMTEHRVASMTLGDAHSVLVTVSGEVFTWGSGGDGRLGHGREDMELGKKGERRGD